MRTFTPGIVGTIMYTAPEVLGVLDEPQQQPSVETVLKVSRVKAHMLYTTVLPYRGDSQVCAGWLISHVMTWTCWV